MCGNCRTHRFSLFSGTERASGGVERQEVPPIGGSSRNAAVCTDVPKRREGPLMRFAVCLGLLSLALLPPAQVQAVVNAPLKGVISDLSKDETKPTGTITVTVNGKTTTYVVDDTTVFEVL